MRKRLSDRGRNRVKCRSNSTVELVVLRKGEVKRLISR